MIGSFKDMIKHINEFNTKMCVDDKSIINDIEKHKWNDSGAAREIEKNCIQEHPDKSEKTMPVLPSKDIFEEGSREGKIIGIDYGFES